MKATTIFVTLFLFGFIAQAEAQALPMADLKELFYHSEGSCKDNTLQFHNAAILVKPKNADPHELIQIDLFIFPDGTYRSKTASLDLTKCNLQVLCKGQYGPPTYGSGTWQLESDKVIRISGLGAGTFQLPDNSVIGVNLTSDEVKYLTNDPYGWVTTTITETSAWGSTVEEFCKANPDFEGIK